jgi:hypothetical protein
MAALAAFAQRGDVQDELGVSGSVLTPTGAPVSDGTVTLQTYGAEVVIPIGPNGRFRIVPHAPGLSRLYVSVPGFTLHRVNLTVPLSKTFTLPPIRVSNPSYFRVRVVSPAGEPIAYPRILRHSVDVNGIPIWEPPGTRVPDKIDPDGTTTIGPLPRGVTTFALDAPPFARMRLPDVRITGESPLIDAGTVRLEPGATLHVDVVNALQAPVAAHDVHLEEAAPSAPTLLASQRTDEQGRATFDRVASGRYRVRMVAEPPCGTRKLAIAHPITARGRGVAHARVVIEGSVNLRLTSSGVPLPAAQISLTPEAPPPLPPPWLREVRVPLQFVRRPFGLPAASSCSGATDSAGRVTLSSFPPGPARVDVRLPNATWIHRLDVRDGRELKLDIPGGFMPLRILHAHTRAPVAGAAITWTSGGSRVEASASATGDALLDGVAAAPGILAIRSPGYVPVELKLQSPPEVLHEIALEPTRDASLQCRVVTESGDPLVDAAVELTPDIPLEIGHVATTDAKGVVRFFDVPPGSLRLMAYAEGYVVSPVKVPAHHVDDVTLVASRTTAR